MVLTRNFSEIVMSCILFCWKIKVLQPVAGVSRSTGAVSGICLSDVISDVGNKGLFWIQECASLAVWSVVRWLLLCLRR